MPIARLCPVAQAVSNDYKRERSSHRPLRYPQHSFPSALHERCSRRRQRTCGAARSRMLEPDEAALEGRSPHCNNRRSRTVSAARKPVNTMCAAPSRGTASLRWVGLQVALGGRQVNRPRRARARSALAFDFAVAVGYAHGYNRACCPWRRCTRCAGHCGRKRGGRRLLVPRFSRHQ